MNIIFIQHLYYKFHPSAITLRTETFKSFLGNWSYWIIINTRVLTWS